MSFQQEIDAAIKEKRLYFVGDALPPDWYAGFVLWKKLAEAGDTKAQYNVGRSYRTGDGIDRDDKEAEIWLHKAAEKNDPRAFFLLYQIKRDHKSPCFDPDAAKTCFERALALGEPRALQHQTDTKAAEERAQAEEVARLRKANNDALQARVDEYTVSFKQLLQQRRFVDAEALAAEAVTNGFEWGKTLLACLKLKLVKSKFEKIVGPKKTYEAGMYQGTTQYISIRSEDYSAVLTFKNNSTETLTIQCDRGPTIKILPGEEAVSQSGFVYKKDETIDTFVALNVIPGLGAHLAKNITFPLLSPIKVKTGWF